MLSTLADLYFNKLFNLLMWHGAYPFLKIFKINIIYSNAKVGSMKPCETKRSVKAIGWLRGMGKGGGGGGKVLRKSMAGVSRAMASLVAKYSQQLLLFLNQYFDHFHMFVIPLKR